MVVRSVKWWIIGGFLTLCFAFTMAISASNQAVAIPTAGDASAVTSAAAAAPLVVPEGEVLDQLNGLTGQSIDLQTQIDALDVELERSIETYNALAIKLDRITIQLGDLRRQRAQVEADYTRHLKLLEERVRHIYKSGGRDNLLPMLLLADGAEDLYNRVVLIAKMANQDSRTLEDLYWSKKNLDRLLADLELQKQDGLDLLRQQQQEGMQIQTKLLQYQALRDNIGAQIDRVIAAERERQAKEQEQVLQSLAELRSGAQQYQGPLPQNGNAVVDQLIETAAAYIGIPYVWAGDRPSTGFDCSGFTQYVFGQHGVELPHYSGYQAQMGLTIQPEDIQAGDLLCFGSPVHHVGIYIGEGLFIHAPRTGDVVRIQPLAERTNLTEIRRFELKFRTSAPAVD